MRSDARIGILRDRSNEEDSVGQWITNRSDEGDRGQQRNRQRTRMVLTCGFLSSRMFLVAQCEPSSRVQNPGMGMLSQRSGSVLSQTAGRSGGARRETSAR
jgi:hypothetical protein